MVEKQDSFFLCDPQTNETIAIGTISKIKPYELPIYDSLGSVVDVEEFRKRAREEY